MTMPALPVQGSTSWYAWASAMDAWQRASGPVNKFKGSPRIRAMADMPPSAPTAMASPPTIGQASTATSGLTVTVPVTAARVRWSARLMTSSLDQPGTVQPRGYTAPNGNIYPQVRTVQMSFDTDAEQFDLSLYGRSTLLYRIWVNEQPVTSTMQTVTAVNAQTFINVNFGSAATGNPRRIMVEFEDLTNPVSLYNLRIGPTRTVTLPSIPTPRVIWVGDSYGQGTGTTHETFAFTRTLGRLMGWPDMWNSTGSMGGTGLVTDADPTYVGHYSTRLAPDVIASNPDLVIIQGSINDPDDGTAGPALTSYVNTLRTSMPSVPIVVTSPLYVAGSFTAFDNVSALLKSTSSTLGLPYLDVLGSGAFTGTGNAGSPAGNGNADVYRGSDGVHPNDLGHYMLARVMSGLLAQVLGLSV